MIEERTARHTLPQDLGDGLVLRRATPADADKLADFNATIHNWPSATGPNESIGAWTRDLLTRPHPTFAPGDFLLVEDTRTGAVASTTNLISQTWSYDGIPFGVGRPELVGTAATYRKRGLVRRQFDVLHAWSAERGELVQAITGIPWYYRQFGYEMGGLALGGGRTGYRAQVPKLEAGKEEPYRLRPATEADLPLLMRLYEEGSRRSLVACVMDEALWRYELNGRSERNEARREWRVIETAAGEPVGILGHPARLWGAALSVNCYELRPGVSWGAVSPSVVRYLAATGREYADRAPHREGQPRQEWEAFGFGLGEEHPVYAALHDRLPRVAPPYAYFLRVPDLPAFVRRIAPVLERRLAASALAGHSGELRISFYRDGLRLVFDGGRLTTAEGWRPTVEDGGKAAFPGLTFLQLLFGYRTLEELRYAFADCWADGDEPRALLTALFPKRASFVWAVS